MSALDFMTVSAGDGGSAAVLARSPMERLARAAGARFEARDGWNVAVAFAEQDVEAERISRSVGFADRSWLVKFEVTAPASAIAGLELAPGVASLRDGAWWCPVTPERVLAFGEPGVAAAAALRTRVDELGGRVVDVTSGLAAMTLAGPLCRELLARFCAIDVRPAVSPVCSLRPGSVARTPGYVLVEADDRLLIMVGWALGQYLWEVVADAATHLGGGPVGIDVLVGAVAHA